MMDVIFYIEGKHKEIFGVRFRPAIMGNAAELGLKSPVSNIPDKKSASPKWQFECNNFIQ
jgi:hypothetical protein